MYVNNVWYSEPELNAYVAQLIKERDAYKAELIETLRKACTCGGEKHTEDCGCQDCPYFYLVQDDVSCPNALSTYAAKLRLEELTGGNKKC